MSESLSATSLDQVSRAEERKRFLRRLLWTRKSSGIGALIVLIFLFTALAAPLLTPFDPADQDLTNRYTPPNSVNLLGTDNFGRDLLSRIIFGTRISLIVGVLTVFIAMVVGGLLGILAGFMGGNVDRIVNFVIEMLMAFPTLLLALVLIAMLGPGLIKLIIAIGIGSVPMFARVLRAETLSVRERDYVLTSRAIGGTQVHIIFYHILPNIVSSLIILSTTRVATAILSESALSFLGLGIQPPTPSWGVLVAEGRAYLQLAPWIALAPGVVIMITVLGFNLFGDGLRDVIDVRRRGRR
jgi:peptide/nickel transport system permease protein